jgi:hypothetical protein
MTSSRSETRSYDGLWVGTFLALFAALLLFTTGSTDFQRFPDRAIGMGLLGGVDASRRYGVYLRIVAVGLALILGVHYLARRLRQLRPGWFQGPRARLEQDIVNTLCGVGSVSLVAIVAADHLEAWPVALAMLAAVVLVGGLGLARRLTGSTVLRQLTVWSTTAPLLLLPWALAYAAGAMLATPKVHPPASFWLASAGLSLLLPVGLVVFLRWPGRWSRARIRQAFAVGAAPLLLFPLLCPVANELQFALAGRLASARKVALLCLGLLALASAALFLLALLGRLRVRARIVSRFCLPVLVAGASLVVAHQHKLGGGGDLLHDGEPSTAIQQLLRFGRWPFVDVWPAHGLSDYFGLLYAAVNGWKPIEIGAWSSALVALTALGTYAVLAAVTTPLFAAGLTALVPIEALFPLPRHSYFYAEPTVLALALLVVWTLRDPTRRRLIWLALATFASFVWMPSSGVACLAGGISLLGLVVVTSSDRAVARRALGAFAAVGLAGLVIYLVALLLRHRPLGDSFRLVLGFFRSEALIGGLPSVLRGFGTMAFFQYILLPAVGFCYLACLARRAIDRRPLRDDQLVLAFITVASFVLFARALSRHGLIEHYQPFFFPFLAATVFVWLRGGRSPQARAWFCLVVALYLVAFPIAPHRSEAAPPYVFHNWSKGESRMTSAPRSYQGLKSFLDTHIGPHDTFLEMLSGPLLYAFTEREVPDSFFLPTMFYATDSVQDAYLRRLALFDRDDRVPIAILPGSSGVGDLDGIPTQVRSYRIAEHVYRHYQPLTTVEGFEIWTSRTRWLRQHPEAQGVRLPLIEPERYQTAHVEARRDADVLIVRATGPDPHISDFVGIPPGAPGEPPALRLRYRTSAPGTLGVSFRRTGGGYSDAATVAVRPASDWQETAVLVPFALAAGQRLEGVRLEPPAGAELSVKDLELVYGQPRAGNPENFSIGMLAFLWGSYDSRAAAHTTVLQQKLALPPDQAQRNRWELAVDPGVDKSTGNYLHLCLSLPASPRPTPPTERPQELVDRPAGWRVAGKVRVRYGTNPGASFEFDLVQPAPDEDQRAFTDGCKDYLVRLSSEYAWMSQPVDSLVLESNTPFRLREANLRKGD